MTCGAPKSTPITKPEATTTAMWSVVAMRAKGRQAAPHMRIIDVR